MHREEVVSSPQTKSVSPLSKVSANSTLVNSTFGNTTTTSTIVQETPQRNNPTALSSTAMTSHVSAAAAAAAPSKADQHTALSGDGWEERFTVDGVPYYYNTLHDTLSWDKPDCLLTEAERKEGKRKWVWIENEKDGWVPLCVVCFFFVEVDLISIGE